MEDKAEKIGTRSAKLKADFDSGAQRNLGREATQ